MSEQTKPCDRKREYLWEILKIIIIPIITWAFIYYGSFVRLETQFNMLCGNFAEFKKDVKDHMNDRAIHKY